jgi:hypothetical protein
MLYRGVPILINRPNKYVSKAICRRIICLKRRIIQTIGRIIRASLFEGLYLLRDSSGSWLIAVYQMNATCGVPAEQEISPIWAEIEREKSWSYFKIPSTPNPAYRSRYESSPSGSIMSHSFGKPRYLAIGLSTSGPRLRSERTDPGSRIQASRWIQAWLAIYLGPPRA